MLPLSYTITLAKSWRMKYKIVYTFLLVSLFCFISCDRPECKNENPIFKTNEPNSKKYKDELVNQLNGIDQSELT